MLLELDHISKIYGDLRAVDDLNPVSYTHLPLPTNSRV